VNPSSSRAKASFRTQLRETARAAILDAAEELIATRGMEGAPLVQIAKRAGIAVGTLYNYFTDRDALVQALFESRRATLRPMIRVAIKANDKLGFEPRLRAFVHDVLAAFEAHRRFVKVAIEAEHRIAPSATSTDVHVAITELVKIGVREKAIAAGRAELLPTLIAGALRAVVLRRIGEDAPLVGDADTIVSIFLDGARA
jgi:AcrR family transcriptional regulator